MRYDFFVSLYLPSNWQGPHTEDTEPQKTAQELEAEIRSHASRIVPTTDSLVDVRAVGYSPWDGQPVLNSVLIVPEPLSRCAHCGQEIQGDPARHYPAECEAANFPPGPPRRAAGENSEPRFLPGTEHTEPCVGAALDLIPEQPSRALEPGYSVNPRFESRHAIEVRNQPKQRYMRCPLCMDRIAITEDPVENHHIAMRHKRTCGQPNLGQWNDQEFSRIKAEFDAQPNVVRMRELGEAAERAKLAAAAAPQIEAPRPADIQPTLTARDSKRPWWQRLLNYLGWPR